MKMINESGIISDELLTIIKNSNDLLFIKDKNFVYIAASKNYATNCVHVNGIEDVIGKTDFELFEDQSIAAKYREDDEKLLVSGMPMTEFQEEYPDKNGKKHLCLITKFLLHDKDGNPAAILGQYHDIGAQIKEKIARRRDINKNVSEALSKSFIAAYYADLKTHKYITIRATDYARKLVGSCETIEQAFDSFIQNLVKQEHQNKMRQFCDSASIAKRIKEKREIDCEYINNAAANWCKASFFPCEWDKDGEVTHVLFTVTPIDEKIAQEIEERNFKKDAFEALVDAIPSGVVVYEWKGKDLEFISANQHYQYMFGYKEIQKGGNPTFPRIHPDDIDGYQKAIAKGLAETHYLEYAFRIWKENEKHYGWVQINAVSKPREDGSALVYAIFTDITRQKNAEMEIAKKQASMEAALKVANQLCCEYDPLLHQISNFTEHNSFDLPLPWDNYPEILREVDLVHPEDVKLIIDTIHSTDDGKTSAHCDIRAKYKGEYRWFFCRFDPYYDAEKERNIVILNFIDATVRMSFIKNYETQINSLLSGKKDTLSLCFINLTKNTFKMTGQKANMDAFIDETASYETVMLGITESMLREEDKEKYRSLFCRKNLLKLAAEGTTHAEMEYLLRFSENHYEWITAYVDMVNNPISGEVTGIAYCRSSQKKHMERGILTKALTKDYIFAAVVFKDTDEFYIYNAESGGFGSRMEHFWEIAFSNNNSKYSQKTIEYLKEFCTKEKMLKYLERHSEYVYFFDSMCTGEKTRIRARFRYLDNDETTLLVTMRNFTDEELQEQWKYDSEHDSLTKLHNRKKFFQDCRSLLNERPDTQFIMIHCDVRHFHLYNTFFGEKAGNKLLIRIADVIKNFEKDYSSYACGRIDSDMFSIFLPVEIDKLENDIKYCFQELDRFSPNFPIQLAIGIYWVTDPSMDIEEMFSRATIAAKSQKKNLFGLISRYDESLEREMLDSQEVISEMTEAIANEQFQVYLQPKYSLRSEKLVGAEALVRWIHPEKGMISPGKFIPVFEKNGFIAEIDRYMWEHTCQILRRWQKEGKPMYPVSVNISRVSMYNHETVPFLKALIKKYELDPKLLELELTETAYMDDPEDLKRMLKELQDYGFKILMDDFGSGYSSLNTLRELPVDILKLDMKFLSTVKNDVRSLAVLSSVVRMSKLLNLPIVAEGVEQKDQADYLRSIGCEYVQGYLYGRPMPVADYEKLLNKSPSTNVDTKKASASGTKLASVDFDTEDSFISLGELEYEKNRFAYLRTNKKFLTEFNLIDDLEPASKVFREHMDKKNYNMLVRGFAECATTKDNILVNIEWQAEKGNIRKYHGYIHYHGNIGSYVDLSVTFVNITGIRTIN